ncbi:MAG: ABC transporter permease [Lautropia sp.]
MSRYGPALLSLIVAGLVWEAVSRLGWVNAVLLPPPSTVLPRLVELVVSGQFVEPLTLTLGLLFLGYGVACLIGVATGAAMAVSSTAFGLLEPLVELMRPIPKPALVPPLFLFLGPGPVTMVAIVVLAAMFPVLINTLQGIREVDPVLVDTARTMRASRARTLLRVILPAALPMILGGMRVSLGLGFVLVVLAEMLAGENGVGFLILDMQRAFQIQDMYAWVILLALVGLGLSSLFELVELRLVPWRSR